MHAVAVVTYQGFWHKGRRFAVSMGNIHDTDANTRFGYTASKKVGNAVARTRVKRKLREIVRLVLADKLNASCDFVLIGRKAGLKRPLSNMAKDALWAAREVGKLHQQENDGAKA